MDSDEARRLARDSEEARRIARERERSRWVRFSLIPLLFIVLVVFVGTTVSVVVVKRQDTANQMVLKRLSNDEDQIIQVVTALSDASAQRQIELALRQEAILCILSILPNERTHKSIDRCTRHVPPAPGG